MSDGWRYELTPHAERDLKRLDRPTRARLFAALDRLVSDPAACDIAKLQGHERTYRLRVGDWRVLYHLDPATRLYTVIAVEARSRAYRA